MDDTPRWLTPDEQRVWRTFLRMQTQLTARLGRELQTESNLSMADYGVLVNLTDVPDGRMRFLELARAVEWEKSRMSHHIARMVRRGLVRREECPDDGRGAFIAITPEGRAAIEAAAPRHVEAVRRLVFDHLSSEQLAALDDISRQIVARTEQTP
ncbi:MarR family winged helix-turn-helix transcriptional regulator [Marinitenerispora sediminis]|uniref:MarR family transcriptional regulator n=1 Tax=Marinitenerispora sediminis TaxID=1931232 RepID=A0A368T957_9ACTN|nr:MarR family transcriptional regulator [Marinitenerispora sediminis]RCV51717.1 MarR family transcriptional regulator [Marinitenerispora sediminis]RCV55100.1 MarR family transcriptional regulator [Marinitenerispora sediminis]RCV59085.1 MarR family transcriptional regulator [Marinitenerispora sediminis]